MDRRAPRTGNHVLNKSLPRTAYEDLVVLQDRKGLNMEGFNNSCNFIATMNWADRRYRQPPLVSVLRSIVFTCETGAC